MCHWSEMPKHCKQRRMALKCWGKNKRLNVMLRYNPNSKLCWQRVNWDRVELISGSGDVASFFFFKRNGPNTHTHKKKKKKKRPAFVWVLFFFPPAPWQREVTPDIEGEEKVGGHWWQRTVSQHGMCSTSSRHGKKKNSAFLHQLARGLFLEACW